MRAYQYGYIAGWTGNKNCPYSANTVEESEWLRGYKEGAADAE